MAAFIPGFAWVNNPRSGGGTYETDGPSSILLHMTVSQSISPSYIAAHPYPPHFWANPYTGERWQTISPDRSAFALYQPDYGNSWTNKKGYTLQTEVVGVPVVNQATYTDAQCRWIGEQVVAPQATWLASVGRPVDLNQVRYHTNSSGSASESWPGRMGEAEWDAFHGLLAHIDVPYNDHWDCSVERLDLIAGYARAALGQGATTPPTEQEDDDDVMRIVYQVGSPPGTVPGDGTVWAINPNAPQAWPISSPYTVAVMQAHGVLMTMEQMAAKKWTYQTDGQSIRAAYQVMSPIEALPDA